MCDVPHEKLIPGKSQNFFGIFAGKVTGTGKKLAGKLVGVLARNCGEKGGGGGSCGELLAVPGFGK